MGLLNNIEDSVTKRLTHAETIRLTYEDLAGIVVDEFIIGSDEAFLKKVKKTAKGGFAILNKEITSKNERYKLHVGTRPHRLLLLSSKPVWIYDHESNKYYQLDKNLKWKKFYKAVETAISRERLKRCR